MWQLSMGVQVISTMQVRAVSDVIACGIQPIQVQCILYSGKLSREKTRMNQSKQEFTVKDLWI